MEAMAMTCNFCHGDATDTYRTKDGPRGACEGCHDEHYGTRLIDCTDCAETFDAALIDRYGHDWLCAECRERDRELWLDDHPDGELHDYERSRCEIPRRRA
jgi:hypothetical protein